MSLAIQPFAGPMRQRPASNMFGSGSYPSAPMYPQGHQSAPIIAPRVNIGAPGIGGYGRYSPSPYLNTNPGDAPRFPDAPIAPTAPGISPMPYLPQGFQAPSPGYIDQMNRTQEASGDRQRRQDNFYKSVQTNNASRYGGEASEARMFGDPNTAARLQGKADTFAPPSAPMFLAPGAMGAPNMAPTGGKGYSTDYKNLVSPPIVNKETGAVTGYGGMTPSQAQAKAAELNGISDPAPNGGPVGLVQNLTGQNIAGASTPPAGDGLSPQQRRTNRNNEQASAATKGARQTPGTTADIDLTHEQALTMWNQMRSQNPAADVMQAAGQFSGHLQQQYGLSKNLANLVAGALSEHKQSDQVYGTQMNQPTNVPLSMLGPQNGLDPSQNYASPRQTTAGPSVQTPATGQTVANATPGYNPISQGVQVAQSPAPAATQPTTQPQPQQAVAQAAPAGQPKTATGANGEKYYLNGNQWTRFQ